MKTHLKKNKDFISFKDIIRSRLEQREIREIQYPGYKHAAVMVLLMNRDNAPYVLLTQRTDKVSTHKGEISFPGGGYDEDDTDYQTTAFRETFEEIGLSRDKIEYLGRFDDYISIFGFNVATFIGTIDFPYELNINRDEISAHLDAPLSLFINQEYTRYELYTHEGNEVKVYFYHYNNYKIWGLTARILTDFGKEICKN